MKTNSVQRRIALITGVSIVLMTVVAGLTMGKVFAPLFEMDPEELSENRMILDATFLYGVIGWIVILFCDLAATWGLYKYYWESSSRKASVMGMFRLIYSMILLYAIVQLVMANVELSKTEADFELVHMKIQAFQSIWQFGLIIFGAHLLYLAPLVCKRKTIRQAISILLFIAGIGYVSSNTADLFIADYEQLRPKVEAVFILPMVLGEFGLAVWLLIKGGREVIPTEKQCVSGSC